MCENNHFKLLFSYPSLLRAVHKPGERSESTETSIIISFLFRWKRRANSNTHRQTRTQIGPWVIIMCVALVSSRPSSVCFAQRNVIKFPYRKHNILYLLFREAYYEREERNKVFHCCSYWRSLTCGHRWKPHCLVCSLPFSSFPFILDFRSLLFACTLYAV